MKLNFWQWLGIIIVVIALIFIIRREMGERNRPPNPTPEVSREQAVEVALAAAATRVLTPAGNEPIPDPAAVL